MFRSRGYNELATANIDHRLASIVESSNIDLDNNSRIVQTPDQIDNLNIMIDSLLSIAPMPFRSPHHLIERVGCYSSILRRSVSSYHPDSRCATYLNPLYESFKDAQILERYALKKRIYLIPNEVINALKWASSPLNRPIILSAHFFCTSARGIRSVMNCIYNNNIRWTLVAIKIGTLIVLTIRDSGALVQNDQVSTVCSDNTYTSFKFNEIITLGLNGRRPKAHDCYNRRSYYTINKLTIGPNEIMFPSRVDCLQNRNEVRKPIRLRKTFHTRISPPNFIEQEMHVMVSWWTGSFLNGSETIICGEKESKIKLKNISAVNIDSLYQGDWEGRWSPQNCLNHLNNTLNLIRSTARRDLVVYGFRWNRTNKTVVTSQLTESYTKYIPSWFSLEQ